MTCAQALQHPWLSTYEDDYPELKFRGVFPGQPGLGDDGLELSTLGGSKDDLLDHSLSITMSKDDLLSL